MHPTIIGLDLAKHIFQVHGVDAAGKVIIRRRRGLDSRGDGVSRISPPPLLPSFAFAIAPFGGGCLCSSSFSAWGVTGISLGILHN